jgi:tubulin polyglutamylase TTLL9
MKPIGKAQGKGIFLADKLSQISEWKRSNMFKPKVGGAVQAAGLYKLR